MRIIGLSTTYNDPNIQPLTMAQLRETMLRFRAKHGPPLRAIKVSDETVHLLLDAFSMYPSQGGINTLYGVPIQIDNTLEPFDCKPVYA